MLIKRDPNRYVETVGSAQPSIALTQVPSGNPMTRVLSSIMKFCESTTRPKLSDELHGILYASDRAPRDDKSVRSVAFGMTSSEIEGKWV